MKTINLEKENIALEEVINLARQEPILLLTPDGKEFFISEVDDFDSEVEKLRQSVSFQKFLDERATSPVVTTLEELEKNIEKELLEQKQRG